MGKAQRDKGASAEREVTKLFIGQGFQARRGNVFYKEPDVIVHDLPWLHIEVKRHEKIAMPAWIRQSEEACKDGQKPCVIFRQNRKEWWCAFPLEVALELLKSKQINLDTDFFD